MIRPGKIAEFESMRTAIECRYMFDAILDNELLKATQRQIKASLFEFVSDNRTQDKERYFQNIPSILCNFVYQAYRLFFLFTFFQQSPKGIDNCLASKFEYQPRRRFISIFEFVGA